MHYYFCRALLPNQWGSGHAVAKGLVIASDGKAAELEFYARYGMHIRDGYDRLPPAFRELSIRAIGVYPTVVTDLMVYARIDGGPYYLTYTFITTNEASQESFAEFIGTIPMSALVGEELEYFGVSGDLSLERIIFEERYGEQLTDYSALKIFNEAGSRTGAA
jgi:hypothetical protein